MYLNFNSHHPLIHKRGVIFGLIEKILRIADPKFQQKNLEFILYGSYTSLA